MSPNGTGMLRFAVVKFSTRIESAFLFFHSCFRHCFKTFAIIQMDLNYIFVSGYDVSGNLLV